MIKIINGVKYYPMNQRIMFGLESMYEHARYMMMCSEDETGVQLTDEQYDYWKKMADECLQLRYDEGCRGYLSGKSYGRAKEITAEREVIRYNRCIESGMSDRDAGACFW